MVNCMVKCCKNRGKIPGVTYHQIPKKNAKAWLDVLKRSPSKRVSNRNVVCSKHFKPHDFKGGKHIYLKPGVVPSLHLEDRSCRKELELAVPSTTSVENNDHMPSTSTVTETDLQIPANISTSLDYDSDTKSISSRETTDASDTVAEVFTFGFKVDTDSTDKQNEEKSIKSATSSSDSFGLKGSPKKRRRIVRTFHTYSKSPRKYEKYLKQEKENIKIVKKKLKMAQQKNRRLKRKISHLKDIVVDLKKKNLLSHDALNHLEQSFSGIPLSLMRRLLIASRSNKKITTKYPEDLRSFALTLQFYSPKAYEYVRSAFNLCLPAQSVIRSWVSNVQCKPGYSTISFEAIREKVNNSKHKILCNLVLDEMHIRRQIEFANNETWGYVDLGTGVSNDESVCATQALVLMVVALNDRWKMPIAYFLINSLNGEERANIVREALHRLHNTGIQVVSITCDGPTVNFSLLSSLGCQLKDISNQKTCFQHPDGNHNVYVQLDACHLLKLIRNNWASLECFLDPEGNRVDFSYIKKLYEIQEDEGLRAATKLRKKHMEWYRQKMKVNLAAQTLSLSVATAIEFLSKDLQHPYFKEVEATVKFIKLVDQIFDLLNSRNPFAKGYKGPLRIDNEAQWRSKFEEAIYYFSNCKDVKGTYLYKTTKKTPFIGMLITIKSTIGLFDEYVKRENSPLKYLLTYKCSQDHLELFFCSIRAKNGWNNNPTAYQFSNTYKRLLLHNEIKNITGNVVSQDATNLLCILQGKKQERVEEPICTLTSTDLHLIRKYNLEVTQDSDLDYLVPDSIPLSEYTENVVAYISGYVIKMIKKKVKCLKCIEVLEEPHLESRDDSNLKLLKRKKFGNLQIPSQDLIQICCATEKKIKQMMQVTDGKMPPESTYQDLLVQHISSQFITNHSIFQDLYFHFDDIPLTEENHKKKLINIIVYSYSKIRMYSISKKQTENVQGSYIRKTFSKLILFNNQ